MTNCLKKAITRFEREEDGSLTVEFVLYFSLMLGILAAAIELSQINLRHAMLERAVEVVVRDIRLDTGTVPQFEEVRAKICEEAAIVENCDSNLMLEMKQVDPRNFVPLPAVPDCINSHQQPRPVRSFEPGQDNELMLIRACLKYNPLLPSGPLAAAIDIDEDGYAKLIVRSAFVQEPR